MIVRELLALLAQAPPDATIVAIYEAGCCASETMTVRVLPDGSVELDADPDPDSPKFHDQRPREAAGGITIKNCHIGTGAFPTSD